ncbi:MAG TPA: hypothetical protein VM163_08235 [bacterium]|nr:hypothetical protein [bacterium]
MSRLRLLAVLFAIVLLSSAQALFAEHVDLAIDTNQEVYHAGDTFEVYVSLENLGDGFNAQLYVAIDYGGVLLFLPGLSTDAAPLISAYCPAGASLSDVMVFSVSLSEGVPEADYILKAAVLSGDTYTVESQIAQCSFSFESGGVEIVSRNDYLPLAEGYSWTYFAEGSGESGQGTAVVEDAQADGDIYEFHVFQEGDTDVELIFLDDGGDIYVRDVIIDGDSSCSDDQLILPADLDEGDHWTVQFTAEGLPITATVTVEGQEDVSVLAGDFEDCWRLQVGTLFDIVTGDLWFAKDVGLVKGSFSASFYGLGTLELLDYELD